MFDIFKKSKKEDLIAPLSGQLLELSEVPDQVFAKKTVGDGFAIRPNKGKLVAPVAGRIEQIFRTKHAVGIKTKTGLELLVHIGINTVELDGEGFTQFAEVGNQVKVGDLLIEFDLEYIQENAVSIITPVVVTNIEQIAKLKLKKLNQIEAGKDKVATVKLSK